MKEVLEKRPVFHPPTTAICPIDKTIRNTFCSGDVIDYGFYATFWGLQQAFTNPSDHVRPEAWSLLVKQLETVLQVFGSFSGASEAEETSSIPGENPTDIAVGESTSENHVDEAAEVSFAP